MAATVKASTTRASTIKAWQYSVINSKLEDSLEVKNDVPAPAQSSLRKGSIIVEVISASLNPVDYKFPEAAVIGRLAISRPATPGLDFSGRVVETHPSDTNYKLGQLVFGGFPSATQHGSLGQQITISADYVAPLPVGIKPEDAAAVGTAATTAYQSLTAGSLKPGHKVFINGGSGGVGTWGIQIAKAMGAAEVVTTCSTKNIELCQQLGADEVVDYKKVDVLAALSDRKTPFDLVIDNVGNSSELYDNRSKLLHPAGAFVLVGVGEAMSFSGILAIGKKSLLSAVTGGPKFHFGRVNNTTEAFTKIGGWISEGKIRAVIDQVFPWEEVPSAYRKLREGHARGKIVVNVADH
ncbi:hypothetical protein ACHAQA_005037 [Verticillium albo-atrum]